MPVDMTEHATYHTDRVTVRMLALMPDDIDNVCAELKHDTPFMAPVGGGAVPDAPMIEVVKFHAWARKRLICQSVIHGGHQFADASYKAPGVLPEALRAGAIGRPCREILDHPAFDDVVWDTEQKDDVDQLHADLNSDIDLGWHPGSRLREIVLAERRRLLDAQA